MPASSKQSKPRKPRKPSEAERHRAASALADLGQKPEHGSKGEAFPKASEAREIKLAEAERFLRQSRAGKPTHNWFIALALGLGIDGPGAGGLYAAMKSEAERFCFAPEGLPASFRAAKGKQRAPRSKPSEKAESKA